MINEIASTQNMSPIAYTIKCVGDHDRCTDVEVVGSLLEEKLVDVADAKRKVAGWTLALSRIYSSVNTPMGAPAR